MTVFNPPDARWVNHWRSPAFRIRKVWRRGPRPNYSDYAERVARYIETVENFREENDNEEFWYRHNGRPWMLPPADYRHPGADLNRRPWSAAGLCRNPECICRAPGWGALLWGLQSRRPDTRRVAFAALILGIAKGTVRL